MAKIVWAAIMTFYYGRSHSSMIRIFETTESLVFFGLSKDTHAFYVFVYKIQVNADFIRYKSIERHAMYLSHIVGRRLLLPLKYKTSSKINNGITYVDWFPINYTAH